MSAETTAVAYADHLREQLPGTLARRELLAPAETRISWDHPRVLAYQESALTVFPAVEVIVTGDTVTGHEVLDDGQVWDYVTYTARIFGTVQGADFEATDRARKRLIAAVKELLHSADTPGVVDRRTRTSYSQVGTDRDRRTLAGAYVEALITVLESPTTPDPDDVPVEIRTVVVGVHKIPADD